MDPLTLTNPIEMLNHLVPELQASFDSGFLIEFGNSGFGITQYMAYAILVWILVLAIVITSMPHLFS